MRQKDVGVLRSELQRRRRSILETARRADLELEALRGAERDPEFEEGAQSEHEQFMLSKLGEVQQREIALIDAAISRIDGGEYAICMDCGTDIDPKRLQALPYALYCTDCAARREKGTVAALEPPTL